MELMKKAISSSSVIILITVLSGCTLFQNSGNPTTTGDPQMVITFPNATVAATMPLTEPSTTSIATDPVTTPITIAPATKPVITKPMTTKPAKTKPGITKPSLTLPITTKPGITNPSITKPMSTKPPMGKSNIPLSMKTALDKSSNGFILIYQPLKYTDIVAVTAWNVVTFDTNSQLLLVTKKKGSLVQVYDTKLTIDLQDRVINDVIRDWTTTADYEVIRIRYSDPETMTMNFIKVTEPGGKKTLTDIKSSMVGLPNWEAFAYD